MHLMFPAWASVSLLELEEVKQKTMYIVQTPPSTKTEIIHTTELELQATHCTSAYYGLSAINKNAISPHLADVAPVISIESMWYNLSWQFH